jgi:SET domain-containing protein
MKNPRAKQNSKELPHENVYTRIKPSKIHGVGVFAIRAIPKGTSIFSGDDAPIVWVRKNQIKGLRGETRRLYDDFSIIKDKGTAYGCPANFNHLTIAWFLNEPKAGQNPNVGCRKDYTFYALRKISVGEELTVNYSTFSEKPFTRNRK